jgi:Tol biopolymer transport system component
MGEVYRARDTRLGRIVAVKVLPSQLAQRPDFRDRFEREARLIASLNHPHICTLHDVGREGDIEYLVMEYLEGETLSSRLDRGPLRFEQTLEYGIQIADALDKAHRKGVTHRDLKPGNIMLTASGAKLLDFGLARWQQPIPHLEGSLSQRATQAEPITAQGTILGTVPYMAPEQLEGREADARTDIFAFGAVLYEMATGRRAFAGPSQASVMAKILESDPAPMRSLQPMTPASLERLVRACLAKDPDKRLQSAQDAKVGLEWIRDAVREPAESSGPVRGRGAPLPWALFGLSVLAFAAFVWLRGMGARSTAETGAMQFEIPLPTELTRFTASFALSPDGRKLAFAAVGSDGTPRVWIRELDSLDIHPLAGTDAVGRLLIWSPDSRSLAFNSGGNLRTIDIGGGTPRTLCKLDRVVQSGSWNKDGVILFGGVGGPLMRVSADGGVPTAVTALDTEHGDVAHVDPYFLPDGRHFLYVRELSTSEDISVGSLDAKPGEQDSRRLLRGGAFGPAYVPSRGGDDGALLFVRGTTLMTQRFDARRLTLSGDPVRVVDQPVGSAVVSAFYAVVNDGMLVYRTPSSRESQLTWFDATGNVLTTVGPRGTWGSLVLSPDATRAIVMKLEQPGSNPSLWSIDMSRGVPTPLAKDPTTGYYRAAFSPDGRSMIFGVARAGELQDLYERPIDAAGDGERLVHSGKVKSASSWSPAGFLLFNVAGNGTELWVLPVKDPDKAVPLLRGGPNYISAYFSPDGHWVAYESNESGRNEIYVKAFSGDRLERGGRVSLNGGYSPRWGPDGKHLYYLGLDYKLMRTTLALGTDVQATHATALIQAPRTLDWWPSPDGQKFLFLAPLQQRDSPFTVVLNWQQRMNR